jgi:nitroreductase
MELIEAMRSVGTCRRFTPTPVPDAVLYTALEAARFGPQGGNRQPVRFVVVGEAGRKRRLGELYGEQWERYTGRYRPASPAQERVSGPGQEIDSFAWSFGEHPAIVVVCAHVPSLLITDAALARPSIVGGASVYPIVQNFMLALRDLGVASALTTMLCAREPEVKELLAIPEDYATACHIAIGYPAKPFSRRLRRRPVEELAFRERFDGAPLQEGTT